MIYARAEGYYAWPGSMRSTKKEKEKEEEKKQEEFIKEKEMRLD